MNGWAMAGMAWCEIAKTAYRAYAASTGNKNFRGDPMPDWYDLPQPIRTAWEAAARQVGACLGETGEGKSEQFDVSRWIGWEPPKVS
jgi:hypothetical protein